MEQLIEIGILQQSDEQDNLYEKILARIAKSDVSSAVLSVKVVHALSNLVFVVKNRWKDKVPTSKLTKKQFVHILAYICDRNSTLEEQDEVEGGEDHDEVKGDDDHYDVEVGHVLDDVDGDDVLDSDEPLRAVVLAMKEQLEQAAATTTSTATTTAKSLRRV